MTKDELKAKFAGAVNLEYENSFKLANGEEKTYRRKIRSYEMLRYFGLGGENGNGPIHPDAQGASWVGDTCVFVVPSRKSPHWNDKLPGAKVGRRMVALCNRCGRFVCPGHLDQHRDGRACVKFGTGHHAPQGSTVRELTPSEIK